MKEWKNLAELLERYEAYPAFIAECVYAYIVNYSFETPRDKDFMNELVNYIERVNSYENQH